MPPGTDAHAAESRALPHQMIKRKLRMLLHTSGLPSEQLYYFARRLFNLKMTDNEMADNVPTKSKHEAYYRSQPSAKTLLR